jgi:hypothetical protein
MMRKRIKKHNHKQTNSINSREVKMSKNRFRKFCKDERILVLANDYYQTNEINEFALNLSILDRKGISDVFIGYRAHLSFLTLVFIAIMCPITASLNYVSFYEFSFFIILLIGTALYFKSCMKIHKLMKRIKT